jgi:hypothetical protein
VSNRLHQPLRHELADETAEQVRQSHARAIEELQAIPLMRGKLIRDVELVDGVETVVPHNLGHRAALFLAIPLQLASGATNGRLLDATLLRTDIDASRMSVLKATGFTVTLKVTLWAV